MYKYYGEDVFNNSNWYGTYYYETGEEGYNIYTDPADNTNATVNFYEDWENTNRPGDMYEYYSDTEYNGTFTNSGGVTNGSISPEEDIFNTSWHDSKLYETDKEFDERYNTPLVNNVTVIPLNSVPTPASVVYTRGTSTSPESVLSNVTDRSRTKRIQFNFESVHIFYVKCRCNDSPNDLCMVTTPSSRIVLQDTEFGVKLFMKILLILQKISIHSASCR